ncbi:MAG: hypothetical protein ACXW4E_02725 [Anaerolineales bacterium]
MAELRCSNCGRNNPDLLEVCQFCQAPLKPESVLRIGDRPTKKNTGELESVLPGWLQDVRQQARDSAEEEAAQDAARPKEQKKEPPDLLAGLASQGGSSDDDEVPDWLSKISPSAKPKPVDPTPSPRTSQDKSATPSTPAPENDFFAQFDQKQSQRASEPVQEDAPSWMDPLTSQSPVSEGKDELSAWFSQAAAQPEETVELDSDAGQSAGWMDNLDSPLPSPKQPAPKEEEDLSWLRNLEEVARQTGDLSAPKQGTDWTASFETPPAASQPSASQEDLSWLDSLGGIEEPPQRPSEPAATSSDDLGWLRGLGATSEPSQPSSIFLADEHLPQEPAPKSFDAAPDRPLSSKPFVSEEDLDWLNKLGGTAEPSQPYTAPVSDTSAKPSSQEDLSWLNDPGGTPESPQPFDAAPNLPTSAEEPSWLKDVGDEPEPLSHPPFAETEADKQVTRRQTSPLGEKQEESVPDWLKRATEAPSMPAPGDVSMEWFNQKDQTIGTAPSARTSQDKPPQEEPVPTTSQPAPFSDLFSAPSEPAPLSNQDVDSLFSMEMPDWLSHPEPEVNVPAATTPTAPPSAESEESLAPVDLPSWVQAMRPVEALISEAAPSLEDQPEEKEGPLAGLRGVIPGAPIGSALRPKPISLKLQATTEQQEGAALLEQILGSETSPRALIAPSFIASQQVLRWALGGLILFVLGTVISLRTQTLPVSLAPLPAEMQFVSDAFANMPENGRVLVVVDYEPSVAGEMDAVGGPLLAHMVSLRHPTLSFLSTSPTGSGLVERLLTNTNINSLAPDGPGYQPGAQYFNLGYLPGGSAGVLGFIESPSAIIPAAGVGSFSEYAALIVMTDHAESGRVWVEQLQNKKQIDPSLASQPLLMVASAQAGPMLQPYVSSRQINGIVSGLSDAARYEAVNNVAPGIARSYWDTFAIGLTLAIVLIIIGSLWSVFAAMRARRPEAQ